ncbi:MAG: hypothetical protein F4Y01_00065 [Gammaproteobacteria bacterium]|nr:hypothetical protein [Gammaproteobacteria bacterium]
MRVVRVYTGDDGESHFQDVDIGVTSEGGIGRLSPLIEGPGVMFREVDGDYDLDFHTAPRRQFVVNLRGSVDITVGSGETRRLESGDILLAEDTTGHGHKSRAVEGQPRSCLFIPINEDAKLP